MIYRTFNTPVMRFIMREYTIIKSRGWQYSGNKLNTGAQTALLLIIFSCLVSIYSIHRSIPLSLSRDFPLTCPQNYVLHQMYSSLIRAYIHLVIPLYNTLVRSLSRFRKKKEKKMYTHLTSNSEHTYNSTPKFSAYYTSLLSSLKGISMYIYTFLHIYLYIYIYALFQGTETCCVEGISWLLLYHLFRLSL